MVQLELLQRAAAIVGAVVDAEHFQVLIQQGHRGKNAVAVQPVGVKIIGFEVGGGDKAHPVLKQSRQQAMKNHGVGDVGHMKLIKTNQPVLFGNALGQFVQRIHCALQPRQFPVHFAHELVKMQPGFPLERHSAKKAIHQKALAPPYSPVHVNTTRDIRTVDQLFEGIGAFLLELRPLLGAAVQCINRPQLRRICGIAAGNQLGLVSFFDVQGYGFLIAI